MDFHSLTRRELQTLCKKNGIRANMTNICMANALKTVQGIEEFSSVNNASSAAHPTAKSASSSWRSDLDKLVCRLQEIIKSYVPDTSEIQELDRELELLPEDMIEKKLDFLQRQIDFIKKSV